MRRIAGNDRDRGPTSSFRESAWLPRCRLFNRAAGFTLIIAAMALTGCSAALGAAMAAGEIRQGLAGAQELVGSSRLLGGSDSAAALDLESPMVGTYRGFQALDGDTVRYYVRTLDRPHTPIVDVNGVVTGYVLAGIAAASLDSLEARVRLVGEGGEIQSEGRAMFFIEGTQMPEANVRALYPAAFLGRTAPGESEALDRQAEELEALEVNLDAPAFDELEGQGISHELFGSVAEGIFTVRPGGEAIFHQEYEMEDGRELTLRFERISRTTLPPSS